jgi:hypothetical protein
MPIFADCPNPTTFSRDANGALILPTSYVTYGNSKIKGPLYFNNVHIDIYNNQPTTSTLTSQGSVLCEYTTATDGTGDNITLVSYVTTVTIKSIFVQIGQDADNPNGFPNKDRWQGPYDLYDPSHIPSQGEYARFICSPSTHKTQEDPFSAFPSTTSTVDNNFFGSLFNSIKNPVDNTITGDINGTTDGTNVAWCPFSIN